MYTVSSSNILLRFVIFVKFYHNDRSESFVQKDFSQTIKDEEEDEKKKKRSCPKCGVMRISQHRGDRICASCIGTQQSVGARAEYICKVPGLIERGRD